MTDVGRTVVLTGVTSVTHLVYAASWLRSQLSSGASIDLYVRRPGTLFGVTRVGQPELESYLPRHERLRIREGDHPAYDNGGDSRVTLLSVGAPGLRSCATLVRRGLGRPHVVVVDEGIGSYGDVHTRLAAYRRVGGSGPWPVVRAAAVAGAHRLLTAERWTTYRRREDGAGGWEVNASVAAEFARHVTGDPSPARTAVYLTQPWPELGVMAVDDYLAHLDQVAEACRTAGLSLVVHPHPADDASRYRGYEVRRTGRPVELDRFVTTADVVIGSNSTALLNVTALEGVRAVRVTPPGTQALEDALSVDQRELLDHFLPPFVTPAQLARALAPGTDGPSPRPV